MKKTIIASLSALMVLAGCGSNNSTTKNSENVDPSVIENLHNPFLEEENKAEPEATVEPTTAPKQDTTVEYGDIKVTVKSGWSYSKELMKSELSLNKEYYPEIPVIKIYKGEVNDSNPYLVLCLKDPCDGMGGQVTYDRVIGLQTIGNYEPFVVNHDYYPYNLLFKDKQSENFYTYEIRLDYDSSSFSRIIYISYFDHGTSDWNEQDVLDMIASIETAKAIGKATVICDNLNVRNGAGKDEEKMWLAHKGYDFEVYEVKTDSEYTWYRIGAYTWIADQNGELVSYTKF